jgi:hypothetical protein
MVETINMTGAQAVVGPQLIHTLYRVLLLKESR